MDLNTVTDVVRRPPDRPGSDWRDGDAYVAGGTWLFSEMQVGLERLVDITTLGWNTIDVTDDGLDIGATCTIHDFYAFEPPADWTAGPLFRFSCESFLASFKIWNSATVGGNICMSLPAGPMITMTVALEASYTLWATDGSERTVDAADFVLANNVNILAPGEILRSIHIPTSALHKRHTHRRFNLTHLGRSTVFLVGTQTPGTDDLLLTVTAGTIHPLRFAFESTPDAETLQQSIDAIPAEVWFDDPNGTPDHRKHLTKHFAEEIRLELAGGDQP